jgi:hypothetical protein
MFIIFNRVTAMAFLLSLVGQWAMAFTSDYHDAVILLRISQVHQALLNKKIPLPGGLAKSDEEVINFAIQNQNKDLKINYTDSGISINHKDLGIALKVKDGEIYIGEDKVNFSKELPASESLRNWAKKYLARKKNPSAYSQLFNYFIPQAQAQLDPLAFAVALAGASGGVSTAVLTGTVVAVALAAGVVGCEVYAISAQNGLSKSVDRLNCYTAPLSWIGANPRDQLYLQYVECGLDGSIDNVTLKSRSGAEAKRNFLFKANQIVSVSEKFQKNGNSAPERIQLNETQLNAENGKYAKKLNPEINFYQSLCKNPQKLSEFRKKRFDQSGKPQFSTDQAPSSKLGTK